jgi:hypothetical protein
MNKKEDYTVKHNFREFQYSLAELLIQHQFP